MAERTVARARPLARPAWSWRRHGATVPRLAVAAVLSLFAVLPLVYMATTSFSPVGNILTVPPVLIPPHPTFVNYVEAWTDASFSRYFFNSAYVTMGTIFLSTLLSAVTAYGFASFEFRGKEAIFYFLLASLAIPSVLMIMPQYLLMKTFGLINSRLGLILLYSSASIPFNTFLLRSFFSGIPRELNEAMQLDGVGEFAMLWRLTLPLSLPALATVGILGFNGAWDEFVLAVTLLNSPAKRTLPVALMVFQGGHTTAWGPLFAASMIVTVPQIVVFAVAQRWFQEGISVSVPQ